MWNFKGYLWNSTQNSIPIHWKMWTLFTCENLRALWFKSSQECLKRPLVPGKFSTNEGRCHCWNMYPHSLRHCSELSQTGQNRIRYYPWKMHTVLLCLVYGLVMSLFFCFFMVIIYNNPSCLLYWHWGNHVIAQSVNGATLKGMGKIDK